MDLHDSLAPEHAELLNREVAYRGAIFETVVDDIRLRTTGAQMRRDYMRHDDAVGILAIRPGSNGEEVLLIRQYRHPVQSMLWEIPAGLLDVDGEDPQDAAARELREESDMAADTWEPLVSFFSTPGCSTERLRIYLATGVHPVGSAFARADEEAEIEVRWVSFSDVLRSVLSEQLGSPTLVAGVLAYAARKGMNAR